MTKLLSGQTVAEMIRQRFPGAVLDATAKDVYVASPRVAEVARFLHDDDALALRYLVELTSVDYIDYFEVVYRLVSFQHNHGTVVKTRVFGRDNPIVPSVTGVWKGANLQEREVYDLMGVRFEGHPNMKRVMLWEGFKGHPLRKDFLLQRP